MYSKTGQNATRVHGAGMEMKEESGHVWIYAARVGEQEENMNAAKSLSLLGFIRRIKFPHSVIHTPRDEIVMWYWENWDNGSVQRSINTRRAWKKKKEKVMRCKRQSLLFKDASLSQLVLTQAEISPSDHRREKTSISDKRGGGPTGSLTLDVRQSAQAKKKKKKRQ